MTTEEQPQPEAGDSVGQQLRHQREQRGLAIADVADELHLRPSVIQSIELGEHERFEGELFLKGYVRAYAGLVGLDPDRLIEALDRELEPLRLERERAQLANPLVDIERRRQRKRQVARVLFLVILALLCGGLVFRFVFMSSTTSDPAVTAPSPAPDTAEEDTGVAAAAVDTGPGSEDTEEPAVGPVPETTEAEASQTTEAPVTGDEVETPATPSVVTDAEPAADTAEPAPEADAVATAAAEASLPARLVMSFTDACWIQVSDGNGKRLAASLKGPGDTLEVAGTAPLHVVIGAVDAVSSIMFEGEPVDLGRFRSINNRTEFTLGP